ncbi:hypothetical protein CLOSTHATH_00253 [Hungatella hathewayi DSM 13479]|uniref:Uncharacterized protein n=1 Tax=Hungatella hathewayi DSM 13479 TaxID=566550 RepID=D3A9I2_9FIRM|nr:hypothetical protein CLOSTHATH_00253 [Hungatella hathewayi DSM 13479]
MRKTGILQLCSASRLSFFFTTSGIFHRSVIILGVHHYQS